MGNWKINVDGGQNLEYGISMIGGVIRDVDGMWCMGFARTIGLCNAYEVELCGTLDGIEQAWKFGCWDVLLELDCLETLHYIKGNPIINQT